MEKIDAPANRWALRPHSQRTVWETLSFLPNEEDLLCTSKSIYFLTYGSDGTMNWFVVPIKDMLLQQSTTSSSVELEVSRSLGKMPDNTSSSLTTLAVPPNRILALGCYSNTNLQIGSKEVLCYDLTKPGLGWHAFPDMQGERFSPFAAVVDGKIYVIGSRSIQDEPGFAEVFDLSSSSSSNCWQRLPFEPPARFPIPSFGNAYAVFWDDEKQHKHLFLHRFPGKQAYTFDLNFPHSLNLVDKEFAMAPSLSAVADGVFFAYDLDTNDIRAYDLVNKVWFPDAVDGLMSCEPEDDDNGEYHLLHVGGKRLCLVHTVQVRYNGDDFGLNITCKIFTFNKEKKPAGGVEEETKLVAHIESVRSYLLGSTFFMTNCIIL